MSADASAGEEPLVFAGRHRPGPIDGVTMLEDRAASPRRLLALLNGASRLVLLDPLCFPFEALRPADRDIPLVVALPPRPAFELEALLGEPLLGHLGPGDRVAAADGTWEAVAGRRGWPAEMRLPARPDDPEAVAREALRRGAVADRAVKAEGRRRAEALAHLLGGRYGPGSRRVADVGGAAGPWRHLLPAGPELIATPPSAPLPAADESQEAAAAMGVLGGLPAAERRALVGEMWRIVRPGGLLAVVEDVVPIPGADRLCPFGRGGLIRLLLEATGRRLVLGRVWSVRFPGEALHRGAGVSAVKVGEARQW